MNPYPTGLAFGGAAARRLQRRLAAKAQENARRVPCRHCELLILPETMPRHLAVVHDIEADAAAERAA